MLMLLDDTDGTGRSFWLVILDINGYVVTLQIHEVYQTQNHRCTSAAELSECNLVHATPAALQYSKSHTKTHEYSISPE